MQEIEEAVHQDYINYVREQVGITYEQAYNKSNWMKSKTSVDIEKKSVDKILHDDRKYLASSSGCLPYREKYL